MYFLRTFAELMTNNDSSITFTPDSLLPVWYRFNLYNDDTAAILPDSSILSVTPKTLGQQTLRFFTETPATQISGSPQVRRLHDIDWLYGSFAIILFLIVLIRITWPVHLKKLFRSAVFPSKAKDENRLFEFRFDSFLILFLLLYCITYSLLAMQFLVDFNLAPMISDQEAPLLFFVFSFTFLILISAKVFMSMIASWIFSTRDEGLYYRDHLLLSGFVSAAILIPLIVVNAFSDSTGFLYVALALLVVSEIIRLIRTVTTGLDKGTFSYVHIFLYFCTLEIVPLLIIGKIILISRVI